MAALGWPSTTTSTDATPARTPRYDDDFAPIFNAEDRTRAKPRKNPVGAPSFGELLEQMLDSAGNPFRKHQGFNAYGNADLFTRVK